MSFEMEMVFPPSVRVSQHVTSLWLPQAVHAAAELGIADVLAERPLTAREVAGRVEADPDATGRLLRALVAAGLLAEKGGRFELTDEGDCLRSDSPITVRAFARLMGSRLVWGDWGRLVDCVRTGQMASKFAEGRSRSDAEHWDEISRDAEWARIFNQAMVEMTREIAPGIVAGIELGGARRVVDVGGGYGGLLCAVLRAHPEVSGAVFDLAHARDGALELFAAEGVAERAAFVAGSFFEDPLPEAEVYLLKNVIHDWDDGNAETILARVRARMPDGSRLLLIEAPLPEELGASWVDQFLSFSDLNVLVNNGGRERTDAEYAQLLDRAGFTRGDVRDGGVFRVFEASP